MTIPKSRSRRAYLPVSLLPSYTTTLFRGYDADGVLRHVDEVERGKACKCFCPQCGQPLVAKKGEERVHHFAHESGEECQWSVERLISDLAVRILAEKGRVFVPDLAYHDYVTEDDQTAFHGKGVELKSAEAVSVSGRKNPDVLLTCYDKKGEHRCLMVIAFGHAVGREELERVRASGQSAFAVDLKEAYRKLAREHGRHFDRRALAERFQDPDFLAAILVDGQCDCSHWLANSVRENLEEESKARKLEIVKNMDRSYGGPWGDARNAGYARPPSRGREMIDAWRAGLFRCRHCGRVGVWDEFYLHSDGNHVCHDCHRRGIE